VVKTALRLLMVAAAAALLSCKSVPEAGTRVFDHPERVVIRGYDGHAMEPFVTRDGRYLLFNNLNDPSVNTNLHYAQRIDDLTFQYRGELTGVNTPALEGVPTMDRHHVLYFVSPRSYDKTFSTIYRGSFANGGVSGVELVPGISRKEPGIVNFDVEVSPDGKVLYFVDSRFARGGPQTADIVIAERRGSAFQRAGNSDHLMQHVNSEALEYAPCISADGLTLFFTRARAGMAGGPAIYLATRNSTTEPFGKPLRLAALEGFFEAPTLSPEERSLYLPQAGRSSIRDLPG
jgi:Tol biopolymer transport system component